MKDLQQLGYLYTKSVRVKFGNHEQWSEIVEQKEKTKKQIALVYRERRGDERATECVTNPRIKDG